jgi:phosphate transport system permease protein
MASTAPGPRDLDLRSLQRSLTRPRTFFSFFLSLLTTLLTLLATVPLFAVLYMLIVKGGYRISVAVFTELPPPPAATIGGGFGNAIAGTFLMVGIAALISVPFGILAAIYLAEVSPYSRLSSTVRFGAKVLSGFPSILAGVFAYGAVVLVTGGFSAVAGGIALSILMVPIVMLTAEEAIRMVPAKMREAAIGMGATQAQTTWKILLPTALPGILTGVMLAVARAAGETAPLLFTAQFSRFWPEDVWDRTASLAFLIYDFSGSPNDNRRELAWAAALVLVVLVLAVNLIGQSLSKKKHP